MALICDKNRAIMYLLQYVKQFALEPFEITVLQFLHKAIYGIVDTILNETAQNIDHLHQLCILSSFLHIGLTRHESGVPVDRRYGSPIPQLRLPRQLLYAELHRHRRSRPHVN